MDDVRLKLAVVKKVANDGTIDVIVEALLEVIDKIEEKPTLGFTPKDKK